MTSAAPLPPRPPRSWLLALGVALLAALSVAPAEAHKRNLARCVTYVLPAGWGTNAAAPSHFPAMSFFAPETWTWADRKLRDHVRIQVLSEYGVTMEAAPRLFESTKLTEGVRPAVELTAYEFRDRPLATIRSPYQAPTRQTVTVGGLPAVRYDTEADVQLDDTPPMAVHTTIWLVDVHGEPLSIDTGYPVSRAAQVTPLLDAFVRSVSFDACR